VSTTRLQPLSLATAGEVRTVERRLGRALSELDARAAVPGARTPEIQLLVQIAGAPVYARFHKGWAKAWRRTDHSTLLWPEALGESDFAALLLPIPARRATLAAGSHPAVVADPVLAVGTGLSPAGLEPLVLAAVTEWIARPGDGFGPRLAPPVVEVMGRRGAIDRRVEGFGQDWPLPAPPA
jgi:hypothetical protein